MMAVPAVALPDDAPHLLVVDDDRRIRDLLSRFLFSEGYRVTTADNAMDARAKLESLSFDLLVLDVMMPGETGFQLAKSLEIGKRQRAGLARSGDHVCEDCFVGLRHAAGSASRGDQSR